MSELPAAAGAILLVDKPAGVTSHDVVQWVRWALRERSVGHFGTLDPPATGLLVLGVGPATRLGPYLTGLDKRYHARIVLGRSTTTDDAEGETLVRVDCPSVTVAGAGPTAAAEVRAAAAGLVGAWSLTPPAVSAIRIDGERSHVRARRGEAVPLSPRPMRVDRLEALDVQAGPDATIVVEAVLDVSKGTYVRSLAVELGRRLGLPAHLGQLRRLRVGDLSVDHPAVVGGLSVERAGVPPRARVVGPADGGADGDRRTASRERLRTALLPPTTGLPLPVLEVANGPSGAALVRALQQGQLARPAPGALVASAPLPSAGLLALVGAASSALILAEVMPDGALQPRRVLQAAPAPLDKASAPDNPPAKP